MTKKANGVLSSVCVMKSDYVNTLCKERACTRIDSVRIQRGSVAWSIKVFLFCWLLAGSAVTAFAEMVWSDEFESGTAPDSTIWSYDLGAGGWGNRELQEYTDHSDNVRIEDGNLVIAVQEFTDADNNRQFTSARIRTQDKLTFKYGTIEARIKVPDLADGLWPAFWTLGNNFGEVGWPFCGEVDVMEMGSSSAITAGVINRRVSSAAHWDNQGAGASYSRFLTTASDLDDGFHIFSMDWTPERITSYIDGKQIWTFFIKSDSCASCSAFHNPHFIILNMAVGGNYPGLLSADQITASTPAEMLIDYVRIFDNGSTELAGSSIPEPPPSPGPEYSGSWFNQDQSGHGFSMAFGTAADGTPLGVIYWYTYDSLGKPIFLIGSGSPDGKTLDVQFESPYGMKYGEFDPDSVTRENGGTASFEFTDQQNASFSYTPSEFTTSAWGHVAPVVDLPLVRLFEVPVNNSSQR